MSKKKINIKFKKILNDLKRRLMYLRNKYKLNKSKGFYTVGGMGYTSSVALGYSLFNKNKTICIDGDGSFLMHLCSIKTTETFFKKNFKYILLNNNSHDTVGEQCTYSDEINIEKNSESIIKGINLVKLGNSLVKVDEIDIRQIIKQNEI